MLADPEFSTVAEIAVVLRTSKMTVYRLIRSGELAAQRFGRSFRVSAASLGAYLNDSHVGAHEAGASVNGHPGGTELPAGRARPGRKGGHEYQE